MTENEKMADEKTLFTIAAASVAGTILSALGHAFGFRDKLKEVKDDVEALKEAREKFMTKEEHAVQCANSKELTGQKLKRIEDKIDAGQRLTESKLDTIIDRINHCRYNRFAEVDQHQPGGGR